MTTGFNPEEFFSGTRAFAIEEKHYYFYGDKQCHVVKSNRPDFADQVAFRVICKDGEVSKAREFVVSMAMGASITKAFKGSEWVGWIKAVKAENENKRIAWQAVKIDGGTIEAEKVKKLVTDLEALLYAREGAKDVSGLDDDVPF